MAKKFLYIITFLFAAVMLTYSICAADVTVNKTTSLQTAITNLGGKGGTITVSEDVTVSGEVKIPAQSGDITFTGKSITLSGNITLEKCAGKVTFDLPISVRGRSAVKIFGGFITHPPAGFPPSLVIGFTSMRWWITTT